MREVRREKQLCRVLVDLSLICLWSDLTMLGTWAWRRERGLRGGGGGGGGGRGRTKGKVYRMKQLTIIVVLAMTFPKSVYSGTSDKGPSEIGTTSIQRTLVAAPC